MVSISAFVTDPLDFQPVYPAVFDVKFDIAKCAPGKLLEVIERTMPECYHSVGISIPCTLHDSDPLVRVVDSDPFNKQSFILNYE